MTRANVLMLGAAGLLAAAGVLLWTMAPRPGVGAADAAAAAQKTAAVRVPSLRVTRSTMREQVLLSGVIQPARRVVVRAEVDGRIVSLGAREHEAVTAGQEIVKLDESLRRAELERTAAAILRAEAAHRLAQLELQRHQDLAKNKVVSRAALDAAASRERETFGALAEARALHDQARELLDRTSIRAPFDGILSRFDLEIGDRVGSAAEVGEVIDLAAVELELGANDTQVVAFRAGEPVELRVGVYPDRVFPALVRDIGSAIRAETRKFPVKVVAENPDRLLLPGMIAETRLEIGAAQPGIRIPRQATIEQFGLAYVFVLDTAQSPAVAHSRRVTTRPVAFAPSQVEVVDGLSPGERIAAGNLRSLRDGLSVLVEETL